MTYANDEMPLVRSSREITAASAAEKRHRPGSKEADSVRIHSTSLSRAHSDRHCQSGSEQAQANHLSRNCKLPTLTQARGCRLHTVDPQLANRPMPLKALGQTGKTATPTSTTSRHQIRTWMPSFFQPWLSQWPPHLKMFST